MSKLTLSRPSGQVRKLTCIAWALALGLAACGDTDTQGLGDGGVNDAGCQAASDCPSGEVCGPAGACAVCFSDSDCEGGATCDANACVAPACASPADCPMGQVCLAGSCAEAPTCDDDTPCPEGLVCGADGTCGPCGVDWDCAMGEVCQMGACAPGQACTTSADCPSDLRCSRGLCRSPCTSPADCGPPMGFFACSMNGECQQRCTASGQCPMGQFCSDTQVCLPAECQGDEDCAMGERCRGAEDGRGRCVMVQACTDNADCPTGQTCDPNSGECVASTMCRTDRDCPNGYCDGSGFCQIALDCSMASCPSGFDCVGTICVPAACRGDADCAAPERCLAGSCQPPASPSSVTEIQILTPAGAVRPGVNRPFAAVALDQTGRAVPGVRFDWTSTSTGVATIDASGVATGGAATGVTQIRAGVNGATGRVESSPVDLENLGPAPAETVVRVTARVGGRPVANAAVEVRAGGQTRSAQTDASGIARFPGLTDRPADVTAASPAHDWVSVLGVTTLDVGLSLPPRSASTEAAGVSGTSDLSRVATSGALQISVAGTSIPSPLVGFDAASVFGGELHTVSIPMVGDVPVPANNTLAVDFMGSSFPLKGEWYASAAPGLRAIWAFGGRIDLQGSGLGIGDLQNIATAVLPFFQRFDHAVLPARALLPVPTVADGDDLDGDGDTQETRPDWSALPSARLTPASPQNLRYELRVSNLPFVTGGNANTLIVLAGVVLPGAGFVPLGIDGQSDGMGNGLVPTFVTRMAAPHGGLETGRYAVLASAVRIEGMALPGPGSTRIFVGARLPPVVDLSSGWQDAPLQAAWSASSRQVSLPPATTADAYRLRFEGAAGGWEVYAATGATLDVPPAPAGLTDRAEGQIMLDAIDLAPSAGAFGRLFDAVSGAPASLDRLTEGFARAELSP